MKVEMVISKSMLVVSGQQSVVSSSSDFWLVLLGEIGSCLWVGHGW